MYYFCRKENHRKSKAEKEQEKLPAGKPDILSDTDCKQIMVSHIVEMKLAHCLNYYYLGKT